MSVHRSIRCRNLGKIIPLHYQKRYLANISNGSFNATQMTGVYKSKIKALLANNKVLAIALQNDRTKKEELLEESKTNANIIMYSRLKLASLSDNLKKVVTVLDETLALLQMHSSVSSSKFTPRNTLGREEFKEQVKEVYMDSIPEEPESPQRKLNNRNIKKMDNQNNTQSDPVHENIHPEIQVDLSDKKNLPPQKLKKIMKTTKHINSSERPSKQNSNKIHMDAIENNGSGQSTASVYNYDEKSPSRSVATKFKKLSKENKNSSSEVCVQKVTSKKRPKTTTNKKGDKITETVVLDSAKKDGCCKEVFSSPLKSNFYKSKLRNDIQILNAVPISKNKNDAKSDHKNLDVTCMLNSVSPSNLHGNINSDTYVVSECEKENGSSNKKRKLSAKKFKSLGEVDLKSTGTKRTHFCNSPLRSLSSKINIENFKSSEKKGKTPQIDDLVTTKQKSASLMHLNESRDFSRSYLQDLTLYQQEMVKNLAENTLLVTAEVHNSPEEPVKADKLKLPEAKCSFSKQPIVLVKDIFQSGKSFCKSISQPACDELLGIPLELKLLEHCSSLKVIPEESMESQDSSTGNCSDESKRKVPKARLKNIEPPLSVEEVEVYFEQPLEEGKRSFRKRSSCINYKEPPTNIKLRR